MSETTLNGTPVTSLTVLMPRIGAWTADVEIDDAMPPTQRVVIDVAGALSLSGSVARGGSELERWRGRIVGGAGGLQRDVPAVAQQGSTLALALADVLARAGETLSVDVGDLSTAAPLWHRIAAPAALAVADVARASGCAWRVLPNGSVWVGRETWPAVAPDVDVIDWRPELGRLELAGDVLGILPGQTLHARSDLTVRVGCVEHRVTADAFRTIVLVEPEERDRGRLVDAVSRLVAALTRRLDYACLYPSTVITQRDDGTLDLHPDDARVPDCRGVPIRGLPGVRVTVPAGARVLLTYEGASPLRPVATLWEADAATQISVNGGTHRAAREGHAVSRSAALATWMNAVTLATGVAPFSGSNVGAIAEGVDAVRLP